MEQDVYKTSNVYKVFLSWDFCELHFYVHSECHIQCKISLDKRLFCFVELYLKDYEKIRLWYLFYVALCSRTF